LVFIIFFFYILRCCDEKNLWRQAIALEQMNGEQWDGVAMKDGGAVRSGWPSGAAGNVLFE
jgi:hypothetical protein